MLVLVLVLVLELVLELELVLVLVLELELELQGYLVYTHFILSCNQCYMFLLHRLTKYSL